MALSLITPDSLNLAQDYAGMGFGGTGSANQLDDYEIGTWTPVIAGSTTAGTGVYTAQTGAYVKVGDLVYATFDCAISSHTGTGSYRIKGLPFTSTSLSGVETVGMCMLSNFNTSASMGTTSLYLGGNSTEIRLYLSNDSTAWVQQGIDTAHSIIASITYRAD